VLLEVLLVPDDLDLAGDLGGDGLEVSDLALGFCHGVFGPEGAAAGDITPFAGHIVGLDVGAHGVDVPELEGSDFGTAVEEEGLAVAAVLYKVVSQLFIPKLQL
jgi:hypothetical protein